MVMILTFDPNATSRKFKIGYNSKTFFFVFSTNVYDAVLPQDSDDVIYFCVQGLKMVKKCHKQLKSPVAELFELSGGHK